MWMPWTSSLLFLLLSLSSVIVQANDLFPRYPDDSPSPTIPPSDPASPSASPSPSSHGALPSSLSTAAAGANSTESSAPTSAAETRTTLTARPSTTAAARLNATSGLESVDDGSLPLPPEITPALSVAGAFLMLSGVIYNLIGIKNKAIQIFISTAYLIALAITVLLVYVLNPPISNAVQGAYFVGAFVPAVGLGGVALIFKDVTEGLGAAAGGFALSMWFLVLKPGGVLTNTVSKAVFIGCWTAGIYTIYFSHHVRSYVIIGATSFAGATAVILGIDCFSLAGLKEFWVYIWALNGKLFPLKQDTYPITRGMTVEIAGIIIFTFFGVLSQLRIWKIVQARKEKKDLEKSDEERQRDEEEAELGRQLQEGQAQERREWERIYGDKNRKTAKASVISTDATSEEKRSTSISTKEVDEKVETPDVRTMPTTAATSRRMSEDSQKERQIIVPIAADDITPGASDDSQVQSPYWTGPSSSAATSISSDDRPKSKDKKSKLSGPAVVPLPFKVPTEEGESDRADSSSVSSLANTKHESEVGQVEQPEPALPKKVSNHAKHLSIMTSTSLEAQIDDNGSTAQKSPFLSHFSFDWEESSTPALADSDVLQSKTCKVESPTETDNNLPPFEVSRDAEANDTPQDHSQYWPLQSEKRSSMESTEHTRQPAQVDLAVQTAELNMPAQTEPTSPIKTPSPDSKSYAGSQTTSLSAAAEPEGPLQRGLSKDKASKVVMQFRTNEWAKHLESAEKPGPDALTPPVPISEESASIVNEQELLKTALTAEPAPAPVINQQPETTSGPKVVRASSTPKQRRPARVPSLHVEDIADKQGPDALRSASSSGQLPTKRGSMKSGARRHSQRSPFPPFQASRNSLIASPIAEDSVAYFPPIPSPSPSNISLNNNLHKLTRRSFTDPSLSREHTSSRTRSSLLPHNPSPEVAAALSNENLPLSQRRSYLRRNSGGDPSFVQTAYSPNTKSKAPKTTAHMAQQPPRQQNYPPVESQVQPQIPEHTLHRASLLAEWRRSKALEHQSRNTPSPNPPRNGIPSFQTPDQSHAANRHSAYSQGLGWGSWTQLGGTGLSSSNQNSTVGKGMVDSVVYSGRDRSSRRASAMSAKEVDNAHREVLRRMQAGANKALARDDR